MKFEVFTAPGTFLSSGTSTALHWLVSTHNEGGGGVKIGKHFPNITFLTRSIWIVYDQFLNVT